MINGTDSKENLDGDDVDKCNKMVEDFVRNTDPSANIILSDRLMINQCFYHFKHIFKDAQKKGGNKAIAAGGEEEQKGGDPH
jgi:hypothetical protein